MTMSEASNGVVVPPDAPDFGVADRAIVEGLRERGLAPQPDGEKAWQTVLPGLRLERGETMVVHVGEGAFFGHVEVIASLEHPSWGRHLIADMVSLDAASADEVLADCVDLYLKMTFDPIRALFDDELFASPAARLVSVVDPGDATGWNLYAWGLDVRGQDHGIVVECLGDGSILTLVGSTLAGYLAEPKLHWCKVYGESQGTELQFGCIFDGQRDGEGEREMPAVLDLPSGPSTWAYRGFMLLVPHGEPDEAVADELRANLGPQPAGRRSWWPFGAGKRRVAWRTV